MRLLALAVAAAILLTLVSGPLSAAMTLDDVKAGIAARIAEIEALSAPDKAQKKEAKCLGKAAKALDFYSGENHKKDLKKGLAAAVKHLEKASSPAPDAAQWLAACRAAEESVAATARIGADSALNALRTEKYERKVLKLMSKAGRLEIKADELWDASSAGKAAKALVKAILKYRKAQAKAEKLHAKEGGDGNGNGGPPATLDRSALAIVLDPEGNPVQNAVVGGGPITDENGVAVGPVQVPAAGWVEVDAAGHATGYVEDGPELNGSKLYFARLTPLASVLYLDTGDAGDITAENDDRVMSCDLDAADFASLPVTVGMAWIDPLDVGPAAVLVPGHANHILRIAFALEASSPDGTPVGLKAGSSVSVLVEDTGESGTSLLARFDPDTGAWEALSGAVSREDADHVRCDLASPGSLYGLFYDGGAAPKTAKAVPEDMAFKLARLALAVAIRDAADPPNDPDVAAALAALAQAARDLADASPDEHGKWALLVAAMASRSLGNDALADELEAEALALAELVALFYMEQNECGYVEAMYAAAAQLDMLGGSAGTVDQLLSKVGDLRAECGRWVGTINFHMNVSRVHPGLEDFTLVSGGGSWREDHFVVIDVDPQTGFVLVKDRMQHFLFYVMYQDMTEECPNYMSHYGVPIVAILELGYTGSWTEANGLSVGPAALISGSPPTISWKQ
ncbi:MAG: hypothetical protein ACYS99_16465, partial [Planctomycetota bacterium]